MAETHVKMFEYKASLNQVHNDTFEKCYFSWPHHVLYIIVLGNYFCTRNDLTSSPSRNSLPFWNWKNGLLLIVKVSHNGLGNFT